MTLKDWSDVATSWIGVLTVITGIATFLVTYVSSKMEEVSERQVQVMDLFTEYNEKQLENREIYAKLRATAGNEIKPLLSLQGNANAIVNQINQKKRASVKDQIGQLGLHPRIDALVYFFERVHACVQVKICDEELAKTLFSSEAHDLNDFLKHFIQERQIYRPEFGFGLEKLSCRSTDPTQCMTPAQLRATQGS